MVPMPPTAPGDIMELDYNQLPVKRFVYVIAGVSAISGLLYGYDVGGSAGTYGGCNQLRSWHV